MSSREHSFTLDDEDRVSPSTTFAPADPTADGVPTPTGAHQMAQEPLQQSPVNFSASPMDGSVAFQGTAAGSPLHPGAMDHIRGLMGNSTAASMSADVDAAMAGLQQPIPATVIASSAPHNTQTLAPTTAAPTTSDPMAAMSALSKADLLRLMEAVLHQSRAAAPAAPPRATAAPTVPAQQLQQPHLHAQLSWEDM